MTTPDPVESLQAALDHALDGEPVDTHLDKLFDTYMSGNYDSYTLAIACYWLGRSREREIVTTTN